MGSHERRRGGLTERSGADIRQPRRGYPGKNASSALVGNPTLSRNPVSPGKRTPTMRLGPRQEGGASGREAEPAGADGSTAAGEGVPRSAYFLGSFLPAVDDEPGGAGEVARAHGGDVSAEAAPAAEAIDSRGSGSPLPPPIAAIAERAYGHDVGDVRVHRDPSADSKMNAEAFTHGRDVFLGGGVDPQADHGRLVMLHELAHVVQGRGAEPTTQARLEVGSSSDPAEHEADRAAEAALDGRRAQIQRRVPGRVHRFGAGTVKYDPKAKPGDNKFQVDEGGHAHMTVEALQAMGLSYDQAAEGYQGNWMRDLSQAMAPGLVDKLRAENLLSVLQIMSIKEFGKGFDEQEFGTYDPVEHMDNPTDLRASDVFQQYERRPDGTPAGVDPNMSIPVFGVDTRSENPAAPMPVSGTENQAYGDVDRRYDETARRTSTINKTDAVPFQVDASAIPVYMNTSKDWCKATLRHSARLGQHDPEGPRQFGSAIHVMQDYYAHSNFCEIGINILIREGRLVIADDESGKTASKVDRTARLDTRLHPNDPKNGEPIKSINLRVKDLPGFKGKKADGEREVMSTGSFNLTDTAVSLLHVMREKILGINPFKEKSNAPSPLVNACLDCIDMTRPDKFNKTGERIASLIRPTGNAVQAAGNTAASGVEGTGNTAKGATDTIFDGMNTVNAFFGGDADYWDKEKKAAGTSITSDTDATAKQIRDVTGWLNRKADEISKREHILRDLHGWASGIDLLAPVKAMARAIPVVGEKIATLIEDTQQKIRELSRQILDDLWTAATTIIIARIEKVIAWLTQQTNIKDKKKAGKNAHKVGPDLLPETVRTLLGNKQAAVERLLGGVGDMYDANGHPTNGIAPRSYTPPSHSEVAKDHHAAAPAGEASQHDHESSEGDAHAHESDWLNNMAEKLAAIASTKIGMKVKAAWDQQAAGAVSPDALAAIDSEVDRYFAHPEDCRDTWVPTAEGFLRDPAMAARLRRELARKV
jgi:hypothetical protein